MAAEAPTETSQIHLQRKVNAFTLTGKIDSKGRITVPSRIRKKLGLEAGDDLRILVENAEVKRKKASSFEEAKAFIQKFSGVKSFSFDGEFVEVVLRG